MSDKFKYVSEERYQQFIQNLYQIENPVNEITDQFNLMRILDSRLLPHGWTEEKALPTVETLLHFFIEEEQYEHCQSIIEAWPELKYNS